MKKTESPHSRHLWLMAICCGVPILGFLLLGSLSLNLPSLELLLILACPLGMGAMIFLMAKDKGHHNRSSSQTPSEQGKTSNRELQIPDEESLSVFYNSRFQGRTGTSFKGRKLRKSV